jgi:Transketolase, thiamine diphosphate binding domain
VTQSSSQQQFDEALLAHAIRALTIDAVEKANSGHPGMPMGMAEIAVALWRRHLKHNPGNPSWAVEQIATLRLMPNTDVWRPCDSFETMVASQTALERKGTPTSLILSRQTLAYQPRNPQQQGDVRRGGYILTGSPGNWPSSASRRGPNLALRSKRRTFSHRTGSMLASCRCRQHTSSIGWINPIGAAFCQTGFRAWRWKRRERLLAQTCRPRGRRHWGRHVWRIRPCG